MDGERTAHLVLRIGLAFAFLYPPLVAIGDPISWMGYFPAFIQSLPVDTMILLHAFGVIEAVLALWVLSGWRIRIPAALMTLMLVGIVVFNLQNFDVLFRDLSIAAMSAALFFWPQPRLRIV